MRAVIREGPERSRELATHSPSLFAALVLAAGLLDTAEHRGVDPDVFVQDAIAMLHESNR